MPRKPITLKRIVGRLQREISKRRRPRVPQAPGLVCTVCGNSKFSYEPVLRPRLIQESQLAPDEVSLLDKREGTQCTRCGELSLDGPGRCDLQHFRLATHVAGIRRFSGLARPAGAGNQPRWLAQSDAPSPPRPSAGRIS